MTATGSGRIVDVAGAVLVGGASSRMGRDKAHLEVDGVAFATHLAGLLAGFLDDVVLVGGDPPADAPGRRVPDEPGPRCALRGVVSALAAVRAPRVLILATDLPRVSADLVLGLIAHPPADVVTPRPPEGPQPLCAVYRREVVLPVARARLQSERLALHGLLDALDTRYLLPDELQALDPDGGALLNVNEPADLRRLEAGG